MLFKVGETVNRGVAVTVGSLLRVKGDRLDELDGECVRVGSLEKL